MFFVIDEQHSLPLDELIFTFARSSGAGGQNVNKVNSKAYLRWNIRLSQSLSEEIKQRFVSRFSSKITEFGDVVIYSDLYRDQPRNVEDCKKKLRLMLLEVLYPPRKRKATKPSYSSQIKRIDSKTAHKKIKESRKKVQW